MTEQPTLVIGSTGKTGSRVARLLRERGVPVRAGSRGSVPPFDWENTATWEPALTGVRAAYVSYSPDLAVPGASDAIAALSKLAVDVGVNRLVLLSGRGELHAQLSEQELRKSGADWTIVRASMFQQNFSEGAFLDAVLAGAIAMPGGEVTEPFVDADDIAEVAAAALTGAEHIGQVYEVTGPRLLGFAEVAKEIAAASGREVIHESVSMAEFGVLLGEYGLPDEWIGMLVDLFTEILDGHNSYLTDGVQRALGRPPRDFSDFAREAAATGVWNTR
jgi:uncharacterized protein YbjT (DUF2867 family)